MKAAFISVVALFAGALAVPVDSGYEALVQRDDSTADLGPHTHFSPKQIEEIEALRRKKKGKTNHLEDDFSPDVGGSQSGTDTTNSTVKLIPALQKPDVAACLKVLNYLAGNKKRDLEDSADSEDFSLAAPLDPGVKGCLQTVAAVAGNLTLELGAKNGTNANEAEAAANNSSLLKNHPTIQPLNTLKESSPKSSIGGGRAKRDEADLDISARDTAAGANLLTNLVGAVQTILNNLLNALQGTSSSSSATDGSDSGSVTGTITGTVTNPIIVGGPLYIAKQILATLTSLRPKRAGFLSSLFGRAEETTSVLQTMSHVVSEMAKQIPELVPHAKKLAEAVDGIRQVAKEQAA